MKKVLGFGCLGLFGIGIIAVIVVIIGLANAPQEEQVVVSTGNQATTRGADSDSPSPEEVELPTLGDAARKGNWQITFLAQDKTTEIKGAFSSEKAQGEFRILTLTLANVGRETHAINSHDFRLETPDGIEYELANVGISALGDDDGPEVFWLIEQIQPGLSKDVRVIFDVPPSVAGFVLDVQGVRFAVPD